MRSWLLSDQGPPPFLRGSTEPFGGFDSTLLGWSPISGYRFTSLSTAATPRASFTRAPSLKTGEVQNSTYSPQKAL